MFRIRVTLSKLTLGVGLYREVDQASEAAGAAEEEATAAAAVAVVGEVKGVDMEVARAGEDSSLVTAAPASVGVSHTIATNRLSHLPNRPHHHLPHNSPIGR